MSGRAVAVLAAAPASTPPGIDPLSWRLALLEDTYEVCAALELVEPAVVLTGDLPEDDITRIAWPGTALVRARTSAAALVALADLGFTHGVVVAPDAPDLPGLLIGKLFRALGSAAVAVCPAQGGGLVALGARLPSPEWLRSVGDTELLDAPDALSVLRRSSPAARDVATAPGWHRLRHADDIAQLDPGLEGWYATRALLR